VIVVERALHRFFDCNRRGHERLAALKLVDGSALIAQLHDPVTKFDDIRKTDLLES